MNVEKFCAEEVARQRDHDPKAVSGLISAWRFAIAKYDEYGTEFPPLTTSFIEQLGFLAKPTINHSGFRMYPIRIGYDTKEHHEIPRRMSMLVSAYNNGDLDPQELYMEYEDIHPFGDGNGRTGKILFNWANGTLRDPVMPENPFNWEIP
jgi:hypothetical protein